MKKNTIIIGLCTYLRPKMLRNALKSVSKLLAPQNTEIIVIIVDNDNKKSSEIIFDQYANELPFATHYYVEEKKGIPFARNLIVEHAISLNADYLFFFDDDEWVDENCLIHHFENIQNDCAISIGPVLPVYSSEQSNFISRYKLHQRERQKTGKIMPNAATNNTLFSIDIFKKMQLRFDPLKSLTGGSDTKLTSEVTKNGQIIRWCDEAIAYENVPNSRVSISWLLKRRYRTATATFNKDKNYFVPLLCTSFTLMKMFIKHFMLGLFKNDTGKVMRSLLMLFGAVVVFFYPLLGQYEEYRKHHGE